MGDVVIARLLKDADKAFDNEQMLDLSKEELMNIMSKRPQVKASKVMNVLIKWAKKKLALEAPKIEKKEEHTEDTQKDDKVEDAKDGDVEMKEDKTEEEKKDDVKVDDNKKEEPTEGKSDDDKKEDGKEDKKVDE